MFNQEGFVERTETGELEAVITHRGKPSPEIGLPVKTQSQTVSYRTTNGEELARAHRFVLPDGTIGASGKNDPKRIFKDGILYRLEKKSKPL